MLTGVAMDAEFSTPHDIAINEVIVADEAAQISLIDDVDNGSLTLSDDGSFEYVPNSSFVGEDSFEYALSFDTPEATPETATAKVTIQVTNSAPDAGADFYSIGAWQQQAIRLEVLGNDSDAEGDELTIASVEPSQAGASITIDTWGKFLWYTPPVITPTVIRMGGELDPDQPESTENTPDDGSNPGWDPFADEFEYTVSDTIGAQTVALVQVQAEANAPGKWTHSLCPEYDAASEVGIDGKAGYEMVINQLFASDIPGLIARPGLQSWQQNNLTQWHAFVDRTGSVKMKAVKNVVLADANDIKPDAQSPVLIEDKLALKPTFGVQSLYIFQVVDKTLGFRPPGVGRLRTPPPSRQPFVANATERQKLARMQGPTLSLSMNYIFVDKAQIEARFAAGSLSQIKFDGIKQHLESIGFQWDVIPEKLERLQVGELGMWEFELGQQNLF